MDTKERNLLISKVLRDMETVLSCSPDDARTVMAAVEGFKFNGTSVEDAGAYVSQLLWKLQLAPTPEAVAHVKNYMGVHSIVADVPEEAQKLLHPTYPFITGLTYNSSTAAYVNEEEPYIKSVIYDRTPTIPKRLPNFFYVEQYMPQKFYSVVSNTLVERALQYGIAVKPEHPYHVWLTPAEAAHAFTTGMDQGFSSGIHRAKISTGTLISINSDYLHRVPEVFYPLHKHSKIVCMQYKKNIEHAALTVEKF